MKKLMVVVSMIFLTSCLLLSQDYTGKGRVKGYVYDDIGNPLEGVKVKLFLVKTQSGFETTTDSEGMWKANWIRGGDWNIDFEKVGYESRKISINISSFIKKTPIEVRMKKVKGSVITDDLKESYIKGNKLFEEGRYEEAKRIYEEIIKENPDAYIINVNLGNCYFKLERYEQAEEFYRKVLENDPENSDALLGIGNCYANRGEDAKSLEWYTRIEFENIVDPTVLFNLGTIFSNNSEYEKSLHYYKKAVEIKGDFIDAIYQLGLTHLTLGNNDEALVAFENYIKYDSDSERASQVKGFIDFLKKKDKDKKIVEIINTNLK